MTSRRAITWIAGTLAALGACSDKKPASTSAPAAAIAVPPAKPAGKPLVEPTTRQLVTAIVNDWTETHATMRLWQRNAAGTWEAAGEPWPAVIGRTGAAWGAGVHGKGAPANRQGPTKVEGDGKSPAGIFAIRAAYGYAPEPPKGTKLEYESSGRGDFECVDDPASPHYAQIVDRKQVPSDWESSEQLMRDDDLYTWVVDVAHNADRTPKAGSCIFLHVWGGPESTTAGCTAMAEPKLAELVKTFDPEAKPMFVLLPRAEYVAMQAAWGLPPATSP